jgi:hypothetical protein
MPRTLLGGVFDQQRGEGVAVAGEELNAGEEAFLEVAVGVEVEHDRGGVLGEGCLFLELKVGGHAAEAIHLIAHLAG